MVCLGSSSSEVQPENLDERICRFTLEYGVMRLHNHANARSSREDVTYGVYASFRRAQVYLWIPVSEWIFTHISESSNFE